MKNNLITIDGVSYYKTPLKIRDNYYYITPDEDVIIDRMNGGSETIHDFFIREITLTRPIAWDMIIEHLESLKPKQKYERYYFKKEASGLCLEVCNVLNDGTKIGSYSCSECRNCLQSCDSGNWIVCRVIDMAIKH